MASSPVLYCPIHTYHSPLQLSASRRERWLRHQCYIIQYILVVSLCSFLSCVVSDGLVTSVILSNTYLSLASAAFCCASWAMASSPVLYCPIHTCHWPLQLSAARHERWPHHQCTPSAFWPSLILSVQPHSELHSAAASSVNNRELVSLSVKIVLFISKRFLIFTL